MKYEMFIHKFVTSREAELAKEALALAVRQVGAYIRYQDAYPCLYVGSERAISATTARMVRAFMLGYNSGLNNAEK